jgi:hypothetical protein
MEFEILRGKTITSFDINEDKSRIKISTSDGEEYLQYHQHDCCESVYVEDIVGDIEDILNVPVIEALELSSPSPPDNKKTEYEESATWTFYRIETCKGGVWIRWYGESNGYYSERVDFILTKEEIV